VSTRFEGSNVIPGNYVHFQVLDLNEMQVQWVLQHFGHSLDVHCINYRQTSDVIERVQIAKILLLQDHDNIGAFANKRLEDICCEGMLNQITIYRGALPNAALDMFNSLYIVIYTSTFWNGIVS